jgi:hypothetical protein
MGVAEDEGPDAAVGRIRTRRAGADRRERLRIPFRRLDYPPAITRDDTAMVAPALPSEPAEDAGRE